MAVFQLNNTSLNSNMVAAIGFFDGVHIAHQSLFVETFQYAKAHNKKPVVITFDKHPQSVIFDLEFKYMTPLKQKSEILHELGFQDVYIIEFDKNIAALKPDVFIETYLKNIHALVCGFDFKFGVGGQGSIKNLEKSAYFKTIVVEEKRLSEQKIGSSLIRDLLRAGQVDAATILLGRYYSVKGEVISGEQKGRLIGYPTANIQTGDYLIPKKGVYASKTRIKGQMYDSMTSIGHNPTLNERHPLSVETYVFNFDEMIYGSIIETFFVARLRDEEKFDSVAALIQQIDEDAKATKERLKTEKQNLHVVKNML